MISVQLKSMCCLKRKRQFIRKLNQLTFALISWLKATIWPHSNTRQIVNISYIGTESILKLRSHKLFIIKLFQKESKTVLVFVPRILKTHIVQTVRLNVNFNSEKI